MAMAQDSQASTDFSGMTSGELCRFVYNGRTGPIGRVCNRPESEHCKDKPGTGDCAHQPGKAVHHSYTREFKCPTCGTREVVA